MENNKNKKSVKFQGDMLNFCDFIQVFVFTRNHHLNQKIVFRIFIAAVLLVNNEESTKFLFCRKSFHSKEMKFYQLYRRHPFLQEMKSRISSHVKKMPET